ncbi:hypothetical protein J437_LFUL015966 [Ladona fulva]|uniref:Uncharacterized protein n=1 Tax=Ladona fulva TaxID=123851 RepID=A0A8K0P4V8_LADFU|nr:hypothetical protein J437_LFUL015966 [Ladona fulva]
MTATTLKFHKILYLNLGEFLILLWDIIATSKTSSLVALEEDKIRLTDIDKIISAELLNPEEGPQLFKVITKDMIDGPFENIKRNPWVVDGQCTKKASSGKFRLVQISTASDGSKFRNRSSAKLRGDSASLFTSTTSPPSSSNSLDSKPSSTLIAFDGFRQADGEGGGDERLYPARGCLIRESRGLGGRFILRQPALLCRITLKISFIFNSIVCTDFIHFGNVDGSVYPLLLGSCVSLITTTHTSTISWFRPPTPCMNSVTAHSNWTDCHLVPQLLLRQNPDIAFQTPKGCQPVHKVDSHLLETCLLVYSQQPLLQLQAECSELPSFQPLLLPLTVAEVEERQQIKTGFSPHKGRKHP